MAGMIFNMVKAIVVAGIFNGYLDSVFDLKTTIDAILVLSDASRQEASIDKGRC